MIKKTLCIIMAFIMAASMAACGICDKANDIAEAATEPADYPADQIPQEEQAVISAEQDIEGTYVSSADDSTLTISAAGESAYCADLTLIRLTNIDDFAGKYDNGILTVSGTDAAGNPITAEIAFSDGQAILTFANSTWEYIQTGTQIAFNKE